MVVSLSLRLEITQEGTVFSIEHLFPCLHLAVPDRIPTEKTTFAGKRLPELSADVPASYIFTVKQGWKGRCEEAVRAGSSQPGRG